jgi:hypothetical protein
MIKYYLMLREYRKVSLMCQDGIIDEILEIGFSVRCYRNHCGDN